LIKWTRATEKEQIKSMGTGINDDDDKMSPSARLKAKKMQNKVNAVTRMTGTSHKKVDSGTGKGSRGGEKIMFSNYHKDSPDRSNEDSNDVDVPPGEYEINLGDDEEDSVD
jgi:hypothetical protein